MQKTLSHLLLVVIAFSALASGSPPIPNPRGEDYVEFVYTDGSGELGLSSWECQTCLEDCDTDTQIITKSECRQVRTLGEQSFDIT